MASASLRKLIIGLLPLTYLWYRVIDSVHLEWSTNPQYSYGWIVPFLCLGLIFRNWTSTQSRISIPSSASPSSFSPSSTQNPASPSAFSIFYFLLFAFGILLFLPARLAAATTPEWRPLQWVLALIAVGSTLYLVRSIWGRAGLAALGFPICFFLIAIPWPTPIEQPIIQSLTRTNASFVVELMGVLGVPAIQHGNLIEVGSGTVGIDEACSGIRSFQSSIMISLFLGEFYSLCWARRGILFVSGIILSFAFNVCRTSFLTWIAAKKGVAAIAQYHDPAGLAILVACTITLWLVGMYLGRSPSNPASTIQHPASSIQDPVPSLPPTDRWSLATQKLIPLSLFLIAWFTAIELGTFLWFHSRESKLVLGPNWKMAFPTSNPSFKPYVISDKTFGLLRYDEGKEGDWMDANNARWHAFYFNWVPGRVAGYLAKRHTPEACLTGAGQTLRAGPDLFVAKVQGIALPIRQYLFEGRGTQMHVFHCRWEAGADQSAAVQHESARMNLIRGIWAGRGKNGQKVIEIIVTGIDTPEQARTALLRQLPTLIDVEPTKAVARK